MGLVQSRPQIIAGIDPGHSGGYADGLGATPFAKLTERDIFDLLARTRPAKVYLEQVHSMPKQGVSSTFKFGQHYGLLRGLLIALQIPFETVSPQKWKKDLGLTRRKGETDVAYKNRSKAKAQELFPQIKVTHAIAEALLIAEWGKRQPGGAAS